MIKIDKRKREETNSNPTDSGWYDWLNLKKMALLPGDRDPKPYIRCDGLVQHHQYVYHTATQSNTSIQNSGPHRSSSWY